MKRIAILLVSETSLPLAEKIRNAYPEATIYMKGHASDVVSIQSFGKTTQELFPASDALIFVGALGICVRAIAPCLKTKLTDPAVICIDSTGRHIIPVVSGHMGGANAFSLELSHLLGGEAVITTQSDNTGLWALDTLPRQYPWETAVSPSGPHASLTDCIAAFVKQKRTALLLDIRDAGTDYLERTCPGHVTLFYRFDAIRQEEFDLLLIVSPFIYKTSIPTLAFYPKVLRMGFGCRKNMPGKAAALYQAIAANLAQHRLAIQSVKSITTIDLKQDEALLHQLLNKEMPACDLQIFSAAELNQIAVPNPSDRVEMATQSGSVSEASALKASGAGLLLIEKQKLSLGKGQEFILAVALDREACRKGHIEIVGAGPGDPELISVRGKYMLEKADLILYAGSLVPKELTFYAKPGATVRSSADLTLEEQFELMKQFYDQGKFIVRLHTGDPCIYGAIQEQMAFFDQDGMSYHITPGISSFQAAAAALRSQFTIPEKTQTIILTRGEGRTPMPEKEQLHKLAVSQSTMCIYLSAALVDKVQEIGRAHV